MTFNIYFSHVYHSDGFTYDEVKKLSKYKDTLQSYFENDPLIFPYDDGKIEVNEEDIWTAKLQIKTTTEQSQKLVELLFPYDFKDESKNGTVGYKLKRLLNDNYLNIQSVEMYD